MAAEAERGLPDVRPHPNVLASTRCPRLEQTHPPGMGYSERDGLPRMGHSERDGLQLGLLHGVRLHRARRAAILVKVK